MDLALGPTERHLVVGNYGSGAVVVMPLAADGRVLPVSQSVVLDGTPGPDPVHQTSLHPQAVIFDPSGRFVVVPDKGFDRTFFPVRDRAPYPNGTGVHRLGTGCGVAAHRFPPQLADLVC